MRELEAFKERSAEEASVNTVDVPRSFNPPTTSPPPVDACCNEVYGTLRAMFFTRLEIKKEG
eukprot:2157703-Pleurochrysis_carterae.AAC.1